MLRIRSHIRSVSGALAAVCLVGACNSGHANTAPPSAALRNRIIPPPHNYALDETPGAVGLMDAKVFSQYGGAEASSKAGFVAGYRMGYINPATNEGISVTVVQFHSAADATAYMQSTIPETLNLAAATHAPYPAVPGAVAVDGTKEYAGAYQHGVVMTRGDYYALIVYVVSAPSSVPVEFKSWVGDEYKRLTQQ